MCKLLREYPANVSLGMTEEDGELFLCRPSWDCGWYWGFGYVGNEHCHMHLDTLGMRDPETARLNFRDRLLKVFPTMDGATKEMDERGVLWEFCDVVLTIYTLRKYADLLGRGGSHYSSKSPHKNVVMNKAEVERINNVVIPMLIDAMYVCLGAVEPMDEADLLKLVEEKQDEN